MSFWLSLVLSTGQLWTSGVLGTIWSSATHSLGGPILLLERRTSPWILLLGKVAVLFQSVMWSGVEKQNHVVFRAIPFNCSVQNWLSQKRRLSAMVSAWLIHSHWNLLPFLPPHFPEPLAPTCFPVRHGSTLEPAAVLCQAAWACAVNKRPWWRLAQCAGSALVGIGSAGAVLKVRTGKTEIRVEVGWEWGAQFRASSPSRQRGARTAV